MDIGAFYPQYGQFFFARAFGARGALGIRSLGERAKNEPFVRKRSWRMCVRCIEVELVYTRKRQNIDIHMQRKNTTAVKILPSTSMACFFCPHVKILSVPEGIHMQLLKPSSQLC